MYASRENFDNVDLLLDYVINILLKIKHVYTNYIYGILQFKFKFGLGFKEKLSIIWNLYLHVLCSFIHTIYSEFVLFYFVGIIKIYQNYDLIVGGVMSLTRNCIMSKIIVVL